VRLFGWHGPVSDGVKVKRWLSMCWRRGGVARRRRWRHLLRRLADDEVVEHPAVEKDGARRRPLDEVPRERATDQLLAGGRRSSNHQPLHLETLLLFDDAFRSLHTTAHLVSTHPARTMIVHCISWRPIVHVHCSPKSRPYRGVNDSY